MNIDFWGPLYSCENCGHPSEATTMWSVKFLYVADIETETAYVCYTCKDKIEWLTYELDGILHQVSIKRFQ